LQIVKRGQKTELTWRSLLRIGSVVPSKKKKEEEDAAAAAVMNAHIHMDKITT